MKKIAAVTLVILGAMLALLGFAGTAQAADSCVAQRSAGIASPTGSPSESPCEEPSEEPSGTPSETVVYPPSESPSPSSVVSPPTGTVDSNDEVAGVADETAALPNTGGPDGLLLGGALALLLAGGTAVLVARRRQTD